jgi:uncharacterized membrane protein YGL010W
MRQIDQLLSKYGESHQNAINKAVHWFCVPSIVFSLFGALMSIPFFTEKTLLFNWATLAYAFAILYYFRLSIPLMIGFVFFGIFIIGGNYSLYNYLGNNASLLFKVNIAIFVIAWIGQFIGHKIEGKKPSFIDDVQYLLIGPAWLMHFIYKKMHINY